MQELDNIENAVQNNEPSIDDAEVVQGAQLTHFTMSEIHNGPLPHPDILAGYEEVLQGSAERILQMAEAEQKTRLEVTSKMQQTDSRDSLLGIIGAIIISLAAIAGGMYVVIKTGSTAGAIGGTTLSVSGIGSIIWNFVQGTKTSWKNNNGNG